MTQPAMAPRLEAPQASLIVIDVQGKLAEQMANADALLTETERLIRGARIFELPILWAEQIPDKLGPTHHRLQDALEGLEPMAKNCFSAWDDPAFQATCEATARRQVLVCGIEGHVCVYQTVRDLLAAGYSVFVVADAVGSRMPENRALALGRMQAEGAHLTSVEMALFEMQRYAEGERFKQVIELIK
ncbi:hydrolase [Marinobacteraceae bacterium S3BR75-40.1]